MARARCSRELVVGEFVVNEFEVEEPVLVVKELKDDEAVEGKPSVCVCCEEGSFL